MKNIYLQWTKNFLINKLLKLVIFVLTGMVKSRGLKLQ